MKFCFSYLIIFIITFQVYAQQPEKEKQSIKIPAVETKEKDSTNTQFSIKPDVQKDKPSSLGIIKNRPLPLDKPKEEFSMIDNSTLRDPGELFEERWNKKAVEQGLKIESMPDQFLGDFISNGS